MEFDSTARKYYEADLSMTFNRSFSYVFSYENVAIWELRENKLRQVKQGIMEAWKDKSLASKLDGRYGLLRS